MGDHVGVAASYPNFEGKHDHDAFFNPADFVEYMRRMGRLDDYSPPAGVVLCYQEWLFDLVLSTEGLERPDRRSGYRSLVRLPSTKGRVGVIGDFGIGAPAAAGVLEDLIALGTRHFISIGTAGSLQRACPVGHTIVCERAIRDEGVSHHYLASATHAEASPTLTASLSNALDIRNVNHAIGTSWTIDTPYRETVSEARRYQAEGVLCVEMEAAALFAIAHYRSIQIASGFVISDSLANLTWDPQFHSDATTSALTELYNTAVRVLEADGGIA